MCPAAVLKSDTSVTGQGERTAEHFCPLCWILLAANGTRVMIKITAGCVGSVLSDNIKKIGKMSKATEVPASCTGEYEPCISSHSTKCPQ